jgi:hypothetical protein
MSNVVPDLLGGVAKAQKGGSKVAKLGQKGKKGKKEESEEDDGDLTDDSMMSADDGEMSDLSADDDYLDGMLSEDDQEDGMCKTPYRILYRILKLVLI